MRSVETPVLRMALAEEGPADGRLLADERTDPRYEPLARRLAEVEQIETPTLMIQGADNRCDLLAGSADQERFFTGGYRARA
ncbi:MAG: hypothetical protein E6G22_11795 [Actinobacteria bacterium]|nr:MAG: hypothetical protein E6G22_11795 [Actinomycetota bacterium]